MSGETVTPCGSGHGRSVRRGQYAIASQSSRLRPRGGGGCVRCPRAGHEVGLTVPPTRLRSAPHNHAWLWQGTAEMSRRSPFRARDNNLPKPSRSSSFARRAYRSHPPARRPAIATRSVVSRNSLSGRVGECPPNTRTDPRQSVSSRLRSCGDAVGSANRVELCGIREPGHVSNLSWRTAEGHVGFGRIGFP